MNKDSLPPIAKFPHLLDEWDFTKNLSLDPNTLYLYSRTEVWWRCHNGHEWQTKFYMRTVKKSDCPYCKGRLAIPGVNDVATLYPKLISEFHPSKNGDLKLSQFKESSGKKVWWICIRGHEWSSKIHTRTKRNYGCPVCSRQKIVSGINDLATLYPNIAKELHPNQNRDIDITILAPKSSKAVTWLCPNRHAYSCSPAKRTIRGDGCPYCSGHRTIVGETDLKTMHPEVLVFWNYKANGSPEKYFSTSATKVLWQCNRNHTWRKAIREQVACNDCPYCAGRRLVIGKNDIATIHPELVKEWDNNKNAVDIHKTKMNHKKKFWWLCSNNHSYPASIDNRKKGKGCPYCASKYPIRGLNDLGTLFPFLVEEWSYKQNRKSPSEYLPKSNQKVWWVCKSEHHWKARISERTRGTGCPDCIKLS